MLSPFTSNHSTGYSNMHRMLITWDGNSTWNTFGGDGVSLGVNAETSPSATFMPSSLGSIQLDVTADLQAWSAGATNLGWAFITGSTNGWDFTSAEGTQAQRPNLSVNFVAIPEPSTETLFLGGAVMLAVILLRRRR